MSALDAFFFYTEEDGRNRAHVGGFALVDGTAPSAAEAAQTLAPKIARISRGFDWCVVPFADVETVRTAFGGTVNDVVLTVVLAGFRTLLQGRGHDVTGKHLRLMNPMPNLPLDVECAGRRAARARPAVLGGRRTRPGRHVFAQPAGPAGRPRPSPSCTPVGWTGPVRCGRRT